MNSNIKEKEISILYLWRIFIKNIKGIIISTLLFLILTITYTFFLVQPDYISTGDVMVQVEQSSNSSSDLNYDYVNAFRLIDTIAELMIKEVVLENALLRLNGLGYNDLDSEYLKSGISISTSPTSYFINISFVDENRLLARDVVDEMINAVIEETNVENAFPVLTDKIRRTSFASEANYNSPNKLLFSIIGLLVGLSISVIVVFLRDIFSTKFKSKDQIEEILSLQVLGVIAKMNPREMKNEK